MIASCGAWVRRGAGRTLLVLLPIAVSATGAAAKDLLRVTFSPHVFAQVNRNDALASTRVWIEAVGHKRGLDLDVQVETFASSAALQEVIRSQADDLYILSTMEYLDLGAEQSLLDPLFVPQNGDFVIDEYALLMRRDRRGALPDLRGKSVLFLSNVGANLGRLWLDTELAAAGLGNLERFCPAAQDVAKPSAAILPVFFGQADACVVDASSFRLMQELNPQLGRDLEVRLSSPPYLECLICVRRDYLQHRTDLIEGLAGLHEEAAGRQLLMVFKINRLVPYTDETLRTVRELQAARQPVARMSFR
jgi:hypothetical protein